ncbi:MAG: type I-C CRISPR-associated protein Cas7/Csd2 [Alphaproteobacteria bacterium]|nr:type I-C CRISPR-associated protein Cas7/Csd2 [Alphaproteobacteria bacterium]
MNPIQHRYDFVFLFDVLDGNPNGDPDADNLPRFDPETGHGLVTDVCLKRKIRNFVSLAHNNKAPYDIYIKEKAVLNDIHDRAYTALGIDTSDSKDGKRKGKGDEVDKARQWMCQNFYDVRTFGAVMSTGTNCGQVRGPVQFSFARSFDPVIPTEHTVTRMVVTTAKEAEKQQGDNRTMGKKNTIPYGLYMAHGFISANLAAQTGFSEHDLQLLWQALGMMFEHDRSAARGLMSTRGLYVFEHESKLGNAPAHALFERIQVTPKDNDKIARKFGDYEINIHNSELPQGITLHCMHESQLLAKAA